MSVLKLAFFIETSSGTTAGRHRKIDSILGPLMFTERQAQQLTVKPYRQWNSYLEKCCLLLSANEAYARAVTLHDHGVQAFFQDHGSLVLWVKEQPLADPAVCLSNGHNGIWNLFEHIGEAPQRCEILAWYHLIENLGNVGRSLNRLNQAEAFLWSGKVEETLALFEPLSQKPAQNFCQYLRKHRSRIVNYTYYQAEGISIGSGAVESTVKQFGRRLKSFLWCSRYPKLDWPINLGRGNAFC